MSYLCIPEITFMNRMVLTISTNFVCVAHCIVAIFYGDNTNEYVDHFMKV